MFKNKNKGKFKIKKEKSGISEFIKRPLPTDEEVKEFDEVLSEASKEEGLSENQEKEEDIEDGLNEIYQDENGDMVDVSKLDIKNKRGAFYWIFSFIVSIAIFGGVGYGLFYYISSNDSNDSTIELSINSSEEVLAGEEFFYEIEYKNLSKVSLKNLRLELSYPDNFIFLDSLPLADKKNSIWMLDDLSSREKDKIKIKGKIVAPKEALSKIVAKITYQPDNFSSEFKKEATNTILVSDIGMNINLEYSTSLLVGHENEININLKPQDNNYLNSFKLVLEKFENMEIVELIKNDMSVDEKTKEEDLLFIEKDSDNSWLISGFSNKEEDLILKYKINNKVNNEEEIKLRFEQVKELSRVEKKINNDSSDEAENDIVIKEKKYYVFYEENFNVEVMKSDLNLTLLINGSRNDKAVDFGDKLNYSIVYANKGETKMKDVVIMAVLDSSFLDWTSLKDNRNGREKGNTISWSKIEMPELKEIDRNEEGIIDFSININTLEEKTLSKDFSVKSYAQFSVGEKANESKDKEDENEDNRSNAIINKINSDLSLKQELRYFSDDNIPVGNGPLPPKIGETSSFKVYWNITNNINELYDTKVKIDLPDYISWDNKERTSVGSVKYIANEHKVIWQIGRLPISVYRADAEFNISFKPVESHKNKIIVLVPGAIVTATDNETGGEIENITSSRTTKLEDDEIARMSSDGRVE